MAYAVVAHVVMARIVLAYVARACIATAHIVMAGAQLQLLCNVLLAVVGVEDQEYLLALHEPRNRLGQPTPLLHSHENSGRP